MKTTINNSRIFRLVLTVFALLIISDNLNAQLKADWISRYNKSDKNDKASAMATDSRGFIYVTGYSEDKEGRTDIMTVKYSSEGNEIWAATLKDLQTRTVMKTSQMQSFQIMQDIHI